MTWHPDMPTEYRNQIVTGDARILAERIPDESVDLIFTDPIYQNIDDYRWLAETAARVLKPDRACLAFYATPLKDLTIEAMKRGGLSYRWDLSLFLPGVGGSVVRDIVCKKTDCLWFEKGTSRTQHHIWDVQFGGAIPTGSRNMHMWCKHEPAIFQWVAAFSEGGSTVVDPFIGGGTVPKVCKMLGRNYVAFEILPDVAELARQRVANTQPPLPHCQPEQLDLGFL